MRVNISAQFMFAVLTSKDKISWDGNARALRSCRGDSTTCKCPKPSALQQHKKLYPCRARSSFPKKQEA